MPKKWKFVEIEFLKSNSLKLTQIEIAKYLNRSVTSINSKANELKIKFRLINNPGDKFGKLTLVREGSRKNGDRSWICSCDCSPTKEVNHTIKQNDLRSGKTKSCGCICRNQDYNYKIEGQATWVYLFSQHKRGTVRKNRVLSNHLTIEDYKKIAKLNCFYCGIEPRKFNVYNNTKIKKVRDITIDRAYVKCNGIDRYDNTLGYTINNSVPCCSECNYIKSSKSGKNFEIWLNRVHTYMLNNNNNNNNNSIKIPNFTKLKRIGTNELRIELINKNIFVETYAGENIEQDNGTYYFDRNNNKYCFVIGNNNIPNYNEWKNYEKK